MSELCLRGRPPRSTAPSPVRHVPLAAGRARRWWPPFRDWLIPTRAVFDDTLDDRLLEDIGLSRADLAALKL